MNFERIEKMTQETLDYEEKKRQIVPKNIEKTKKIARLESRNSRLVNDVNLFRHRLLDIEDATKPLRVVLKRDKESGRSTVGIIETIFSGQGLETVNMARFTVVNTEIDKEHDSDMQIAIVVEQSYGHAVYQGGQGDITKKISSSHRFERYQSAQFISSSIDSVEETFEIFRQAAMDPDLNPMHAEKLAFPPENTAVA